MQKLHQTNFYILCCWNCQQLRVPSILAGLQRRGAGCHTPGHACAVEVGQQSKVAEPKNSNFSNRPWGTMAGASQTQGWHESTSGLLFITRPLHYKLMAAHHHCDEVAIQSRSALWRPGDSSHLRDYEAWQDRITEGGSMGAPLQLEMASWV